MPLWPILYEDRDMNRILLGMGLAAMGVVVQGCGGPEKPPLMPDGPLETMPAGSDGGDTPTTASAPAPAAPASAAPVTPAAPAAPAKK